MLRGDPETRALSTFGFRDGKLAVVDRSTAPADHAAAKRIIGTSKYGAPEDAETPPSIFGRWRSGDRLVIAIARRRGKIDSYLSVKSVRRTLPLSPIMQTKVCGFALFARSSMLRR